MMRELMMRGRWLLFVLVVLAAPHAEAQSAGDRAQKLFEEGRKLLDDARFAEACTAFEASQKLDPRITTLLNLAACRELNQQLATARELFGDALVMATTAGGDPTLAKVATEHISSLDPRLSRLTIAVPPDRQVPGLTVARGKDPVAPANWNRALPIDGGTYTITASAPGRQPWSTTRAIKAEGDSQTVEIPRLTESAPPAISTRPGSASGTESPRETPAGTEPTERGASAPGATPPSSAPVGGQPAAGQPSQVLPLAFGAGAVALGGAAIGFHFWGNSRYDRALQENAAGNRVEAEKLRDAANLRRYLAQGFGAAAVGCAGVAIYLYLRERGEHPSSTAMTPVIAPDLAGVAVVGRW